MDNKDVTALVKAMKRALKKDHGIEVPHSALRASFLSAQGEHPHAFAAKSEAIADQTLTPETSWRSISLFLAEDEQGTGELVRLALDAEHEIVIPESFRFDTALLVSLHAQLPRTPKYGFPDYFAKPAQFFLERFQLGVAPDYRATHEDLGDDSGDSCKLTVRLSPRDWMTLANAALDHNPAFAKSVEIWVYRHYSRMFSRQSLDEKARWVREYLALAETAQVGIVLPATFEYTYPDQDGYDLDAEVNLETGFVVLSKEIPEDVTDSSVTTRIWVRHSDYSVYYKLEPGNWQVYAEDLKVLQKAVDYRPSR